MYLVVVHQEFYFDDKENYFEEVYFACLPKCIFIVLFKREMSLIAQVCLCTHYDANYNKVLHNTIKLVIK